MKASRSLLWLVLLLAACGILPKKKKEEIPKATLPAWIGQIVMVDTVHKFALVDTGGSSQMLPGKRLLAFRDLQKTAGLQTTADNVPPFLAVEIIEGTPNKGDKVALDESRPLEPAGE